MVEIGKQGPGEVRVRAPGEYDLTVERSDGRILQFSRGSNNALPDLQPIPAEDPQRFTIETGLERTVARNADGSIAWATTIDEPVIDELPPIEVPGGVLLATSSGQPLVLDHR